MKDSCLEIWTTQRLDFLPLAQKKKKYHVGGKWEIWARPRGGGGGLLWNPGTRCLKRRACLCESCSGNGVLNISTLCRLLSATSMQLSSSLWPGSPPGFRGWLWRFRGMFIHGIRAIDFESGLVGWEGDVALKFEGARYWCVGRCNRCWGIGLCRLCVLQKLSGSLRLLTLIFRGGYFWVVACRIPTSFARLIAGTRSICRNVTFLLHLGLYHYPVCK